MEQSGELYISGGFALGKALLILTQNESIH